MYLRSQAPRTVLVLRIIVGSKVVVLAHFVNPLEQTSGEGVSRDGGGSAFGKQSTRSGPKQEISLHQQYLRSPRTSFNHRSPSVRDPTLRAYPRPLLHNFCESASPAPLHVRGKLRLTYGKTIMHTQTGAQRSATPDHGTDGE
ncbi:hypothetical protein B0H11DRAFT_1914440 [Mycena galericulata]|nr:hypothetical protein B0H11DRAFT_1914440 [Mycena galericulata]